MCDFGFFTLSSATKQPHPSSPCFTWGLWPNSSTMCRTNETKLDDPTVLKPCLAQGSASARCPHTGCTGCQLIFQIKSAVFLKNHSPEGSSWG